MSFLCIVKTLITKQNIVLRFVGVVLSNCCDILLVSY